MGCSPWALELCWCLRELLRVPLRSQGYCGAGTRLSGLHWVSLPLGLALGSPIFPSGCEGKLGVAHESLQGQRDLT